MKRSLLMLALMAAVVLACSSVALAQQQQPREQTKPEQSKQPADPADASDKQRGGEVRPDYYIVVLNDDEDAPGVAREHAQSAGASVSHVYRYAFQGYAAKIPKASLDRVKNDSRVQFVEEDKTVVAFEQTLPTGINRIEGDTSTTKAGDGADKADVGAAVIDTGIQRDHPDLNVVGGYNCTSSDRTRWNDGNGHGTHVAGTIGAKDDGQGVVGAAPGAKLYAVKVLNNNGSGFTSWINCGIDWVAGNAQSKGIKVANMSLGGSSSENEAQYGCNSSSMHKAICNAVKNKYVPFVVAAGNSNADLKNYAPAKFDEVLTVTAEADFDGKAGSAAQPTCRNDVGTDDKAATFSNWTTSTHLDVNHTIAAPGVCIDSTWIGSSYKAISGTSMASPHMAGAVALCLSPRSDGSPGPCAGKKPSEIISKFIGDANTKSSLKETWPDSTSTSYPTYYLDPYYGFDNDVNYPLSGTNHYYSYLGYVGGY